MIDWNASAELNECTVEWLKARFVRFPKSNKRVIVICDVCGESRDLRFQDYVPLCNGCSHRTPEFRNAASLRAIERFTDQSSCDAVSRGKKQYHIDNPNAGIEQGEKTKQFYDDHPEAREAARLRGIVRFSTQESCDRMSEIKIQFNKDHPEAGEAHSEFMKLFMKEQWADPESRKLMLESRLNSDKVKAWYEKMRGGNYILKHHFIYDHNNPNHHTVEITCTEHAIHHAWMRRNGLKVLHLNVTEENKDIFIRR